MYNQNISNTNLFYNLCQQDGHKNKIINNENTKRNSHSIFKNNNYNNKHLDFNILNNDNKYQNNNNNNETKLNSFLKNNINKENNNIYYNKTNSNYKNNLNNNLCNTCFCQICSCLLNLCCYFKEINNNSIKNNNNNFNNFNFNKNLKNTSKTIETSRFHKFLARFSGRRRSLQHNLNRLTSTLVCILIVISLFNFTEACSARTTPKPRPPPTPTPRPNITFHTYKCPATYAEWYCLNDATCFSVKIGDEILYNCWCADGYMGPRCEYKEIDGSFLPTRPRIMMETASIASGATLALIVVLILCFVLYIRYQQNQKQKLAEQSNGNAAGIDTVDGFPPSTLQFQERRPFGPHHSIPIPMAATLKR